MLKKLNHITIFLLVGFLSFGLLLSCEKDEVTTGAVELDSFGPSPILRGGELRFIGNNLDQVTAIILPVNVEVTAFVTKTPELLVITVPEATVDGKVTLKTPQGDIETKTLLTISEPITISSISPGKVRPGEVVTIEGTYLNLVKEVIFSSRKSVTSFVSQERGKLEVAVPADAQTGILLLSNGEADPILVESETELEVTLPAVAQMTPNPVKAGTMLTIEGTDLDLTKTIAFGGGTRVETFVSITADKIEVMAPDNSQDGKIRLIAASLVEVETPAALTMVVPTIAEVSPNPGKNGREVTITGTDLDLVTSVTFGGGKTGEITTHAAEEMTVKVPVDAVEDVLTLGTRANKSVSSNSVLALVKPVIEQISPMEAKANEVVTVTGTDLDLVTNVLFADGTDIKIQGGSETEISFTVPPGVTSGLLTVVATNGAQVVSENALSILASNVPVVSSMPITAKPGQMITIEGEKLDFIAEIIFPGNVKATRYGIKTATLLEVFIPQEVDKGVGKLIFVTTENQHVESPEINIQGVDPVIDPTLVFFDFNGSGAKDSWWGDAGAIENDPGLQVDGTSYFRVNQNRNGWTGLFWRNGKNNFPADQIGANIDEYVVKLDINILEPINGGALKIRLKGVEGDFWYIWGPAGVDGQVIEPTDGWITLSVPISAFKDNYGWGDNSPTDMSQMDSDFGMAFDNGASKLNFAVDNVRFERVN